MYIGAGDDQAFGCSDLLAVVGEIELSIALIS